MSPDHQGTHDRQGGQDDALSVRDLIAELAQIENLHRASRLARPGDGSAVDRAGSVDSRLREQQIVGLLRQHHQIPRPTAPPA